MAAAGTMRCSIILFVTSVRMPSGSAQTNRLIAADGGRSKSTWEMYLWYGAFPILDGSD